MNTAVRALPQRQFATRVESQKIAFKHVLQIMLLASLVLLSAFAVVYAKDLNRRLFIDYQNLQDGQNQLYVRLGKVIIGAKHLVNPSASSNHCNATVEYGCTRGE